MVLRYIKQSILIVLLAITFSSCVFEEEEEFFCDKNSIVKEGDGDKICASAWVNRYVKSEGYESLKVDISWTGRNLSLTILAPDGNIEIGKTYTMGSGASFWFAEINQTFSTAITITKLDQENKLVSGTFAAEAEGAYNYQTYEYNVSGSFTDVQIY